MLQNIILLSILIAVQCQFTPLRQHPWLKVNKEVPLSANHTESYNDCTAKYYRYGGRTLASSTYLAQNNHHSLSHFTLIGTLNDENTIKVEKFKAKCLGLIISKSWILSEKECVVGHQKKLNYVKVGVDRYGGWENKNAILIKAKRVVQHPERQELVLLETEMIR